MMNCGCRNCENCKCAPVFDIADLRDKIRTLKVQKAELIQTAENLNNEIESKTSKLREARHYRLQVDPDPDLRLRLADTASVIGDTHELEDQKFRIANEKIEMELLMQEIRGALPLLERETRWRETVAARGKKTTAKLNKAVEKSQATTPTVWNTSEDMKQAVKDAMELALASKATRSTVLESEKQRNADFSGIVSSRRKELARLMHDRDNLRSVISQIDQQWRTEKFRQQLVREEHLSQREALRRFHGGFGFQTEAFLRETGGDMSAALPVQRVVAALRPWLLPLDEAALKAERPGDSSASWLTEEIVVNQLELIQRGVAELRSSASEKQLRQSDSGASVGLQAHANKASRASLESLEDFNFFDEENREENAPDGVVNQEEKHQEAADEDEPEELLIVRERRESKPVLEPSKSRQELLNSRIDFRTFCMLFDRLIVVYDA